MKKEEILKRFKVNPEITSYELINWIKTMQDEVAPNKYKKGDVFNYNVVFKPRPYVIIKQVRDTVIAIPLSLTDDELSIHPYSSRFFGEGFFSKQLMTFKISHIEGKFIGVLDDNKNINIAFKKIKEYYFNI